MNWKPHVAGLIHAYNCTRQTPRLTVDIAFVLEVEGKKEPSTKYAETMKERLKTVYELASRSTRTAQE